MSVVRSYEGLDEVIAVDALGGLDPAEQEELRRALTDHGDDCPDCARLFAQHGEVAAALALALAPAPVGVREEERLLAAARLSPHLQPGPEAEPPPPRDLPPGIVVLEPPRRARRWITAIAVAASLVVGVVAGFAVAPRAPSGTSALLEFEARPGTRLATLPPVGGSGHALTVAYRPGQSAAWIVGSAFTKPAGGRTYELWYHRTGDPTGQMSPGGLFVPIYGDVIAPVHVGTSFDLLAVTVEPPGGSDHPTTQPVYVSSALR